MKTQTQYLNTRVELLDTRELGRDLARKTPGVSIRFEATWGLADTPAGPILLTRCGLGMARPISAERPGWIEFFPDTPDMHVITPTWLWLTETRLDDYRTGDNTELHSFLLGDPTWVWREAFSAAFEGSAGCPGATRAKRRRDGALTARQVAGIAADLATVLGSAPVEDLRDIVAEVDHELVHPGVGHNRWGIVGRYIAFKIEQVRFALPEAR